MINSKQAITVNPLFGDRDSRPPLAAPAII